MQIGSIVVVRPDAPARFRNIKPGSLFKVVRLRNGYGKIVVGDQNTPAIATRAQYFYELSGSDRAHIRNTGNTDLAVRLAALEGWGPTSPAFSSEVGVEVNGVKAVFNREVAKALAAKNSGKLLQGKLRQALGR